MHKSSNISIFKMKLKFLTISRVPGDFLAICSKLEGDGGLLNSDFH